MSWLSTSFERPTPASLLVVVVAAQVTIASRAGCQGELSQPPATVEDRPVATWAGGSIGREELEASIAAELRDMDVRYALERFELLQRALDRRVVSELLEAERQRRGLPDVEALLQVEVRDKVGEPSEAELLSAYDRLVQQMPNITYIDTVPTLRRTLIEQRRKLREETFLDELRAREGLELSLPYPEIPRTAVNIREHDQVLGPADAPVTLVEFTEYPCQYCRRLAPQLVRLQQAHPNHLRLVIKDLPLSQMPFGRQGPIAARCAGEQGRYWEFHRHLMEHPEVETSEQLVTVASLLGLDMSAWNTCVHDEVWQVRLDEDREDGRAAGVFATPTLFINGLQVTGAASYALLDALVDQEVARIGDEVAHGRR